MDMEKQKFMDTFEENRRKELIELSLMHKDEDLFYKMTSENWKDYLYSSEAITEKEFKLSKPFSVEEKTEFSSFKNGESRCFFKKPIQRIYEIDKENKEAISEGKAFYEILNTLNNTDTFVEKAIFVKEMLKAKEFLQPAAVSFLELLSENEDMLYNCHFVFDNDGLNGSFSLENSTLQLQEVQANIETKSKITDVVNYYLDNDYDFFFTINEQLLIEEN